MARHRCLRRPCPATRPLPRPARGLAAWLPPGRLPAAPRPLRARGRGQPGRVSATRVSSRGGGINTGPGEGAWEGPEMAASLPFASGHPASLPDLCSLDWGRGEGGPHTGHSLPRGSLGYHSPKYLGTLPGQYFPGLTRPLRAVRGWTVGTLKGTREVPREHLRCPLSFNTLTTP